MPPGPPTAPAARARSEGAQPAAGAGGVLHTPLDWKPPPPPDQLSGEQAAQEIVSQCEKLIESTKDAPKKGRLHYECARLLETPLGDLKRAAEHYLAARELIGDHIPTLRGTRRVLLRQGKAKVALPLFDAEVRLTKSPTRKAVLMYEKGRLLEDELGQKKEARDAYLAALELDESNPTLLKAVERSQRASSAWDALERTFEKTAQAVRSDTRHQAALLVERARLVEQRKGDAQAAAELYQTAFEADPRAPGALGALKRLHHANKRHQDLIDVLEKEVELVGDSAARGMALYRIGRVYIDSLGNYEKGMQALERAAQELPSDTVVLTELASRYEGAGRHEDLTRVLERLVEQSTSPVDRLVHTLRMAEVYADNLKALDRATVCYELALEIDPAFTPALQALRNLYERQGKWGSLVKIYLNEAENALDPERRASAFARVAAIQEERLGDASAALASHARALGVVPGYPPSFKALSRLYSAGGMFRELAELYERAVDQAEDRETKVAYLFKIGRIHEDALNQPSHGSTAYKRILELERDNLGAIHAWQRSSERAGQYKDLIEALELEAAQLKDKRRQVPLLHRAGEVADELLNDLGMALQKYKSVLALDPSYTPTLSRLGKVLHREGRWDELLDTYKAELGATSKGAARAALLCQMADLCDRKLAREDDAIRFYREAIENDPKQLAAREALRHKLAQRGQWEDLVALCGVELAEETNPERRARLSYLMGEACETRLSDTNRALEAYERALADVPTFRPAIDGRLRLLATKRDSKKLVLELERELSESSDPVLQVGALLREGELWRDDLNDKERAIESFRRVLERDPGHLGALLALEVLYSEAGKLDELSAIYEAQSRVLGDVSARVAVLREMGRLTRRRGASVEAAKQSQFSILQLDPTDVPALCELEAIAIGEKDGQLLAHVDAKLSSVVEESALSAAHYTRLGEALELSGDPTAGDVYRRAVNLDPENVAATRGLSRLAERGGDPALLEEAAELEARIALDSERAAQLLIRSAEQRATTHQDPAAAVRVLERALELFPEHQGAAGRLRELSLASGRLDELVATLTHAAQSATSPERSASLWIRVADLMSDKKGDLAAAITALNRVLQKLPNHKQTLMKLADLYARDKQWAQAVEHFKKVLALRPERETALSANLRVAQILDEHLSERERALAALSAALEIDSSNREALKRTLGLQIAMAKTGPAADTAARLVRASPERLERAEAYAKLGQLEQSRERVSEALDAYEQAVVLGGAEGEAAERMRQLFTQQRAAGKTPPWARYATAMTKFIEQSNAPAGELGATFAELAKVYHHELSNPSEAIAVLERGLAHSPNHAAMRAELAACLKQAGDFARALPELRRLLEVDVMRAQTWRDLAAVLDGQDRHAESLLALSGLVAIGAASELEASAYASRPIRAAQAHPQSFDLDALMSIDALGGPDTRSDLLGTLFDSLGKLYPPELERYGLSTRDKIGARSSHPLRMLGDRVASAFGVEEYDLYVHRAHSGLAEVEFTDPVSILVPEYVSNLSESQQTFMLSRVMANLARKLIVVDKLPPHAIEVLLACAARHVDPSFGSNLGDEEYLTSFAKRVYKSVSWLGRGRMEEAAALYLGAQHLEIGEWVRKVRLTATRAALILADDLVGPIDMVRRTEADLAGLQGEQLNEGLRLVQDLMRFWMSEPAVTVRRRAGLL